MSTEMVDLILFLFPLLFCLNYNLIKMTEYNDPFLNKNLGTLNPDLSCHYIMQLKLACSVILHKRLTVKTHIAKVVGLILAKVMHAHSQLA